jgi:hypothetical protein
MWPWIWHTPTLYDLGEATPCMLYHMIIIIQHACLKQLRAGAHALTCFEQAIKKIYSMHACGQIATYVPNYWQVHSAANAPCQCIATKLKQLGRWHQHVVYVHGAFR